MIKDIVKNLKPSSTLRINEISQALELEGKKVFKFGFGQSPFQIPDDVVDELKNNAYQNKYLPMQGLSELRTAISRYASSQNNQNYKAENIIIGPGTKELMFLLQLLFDGDILLPTPSWVSYAPQALLGRNKVCWIETTSENNWFPTAKEIEKTILKNNGDMKIWYTDNYDRIPIKIEIKINDTMIIVRDYGRGIPLGKVHDCVSKINTGAKYDTKVFQKTVGLNGVGSKAVNALSEFFKKSITFMMNEI